MLFSYLVIEKNLMINLDMLLALAYSVWGFP